MGNICRSPMAHTFMEKLIADKGLSQSYHIDSAGMGSWHEGQPANTRMQETAGKHGLSIRHKAQTFKASFATEFDYIFAMDQSNLEDIHRVVGEKSTAKIMLFRVVDTQKDSEEVPDPFYGAAGFETVYTLIERNCRLLLAAIATNKL